ncbi:MAG: serine/threonine-protein kinase [Phycisphaerales bacterium]|nr:serine/threonine-protein kinase [Phycisphaerales bacterium]
MTKLKSISRYNILAHLGDGARSSIYAVQDSKTKQVWALKHVLRVTEKDDRFIEQTEGEYAIGSKLDHPAIRKTERLIRSRKLLKTTSVSLIMELVDAATFDQRMPRDYGEIVHVFHQIAQGLVHMHGRGFVHADIKPTNVLVLEDLSVKIIDLGQACAIGTVKSRIQGTPGYIAPEQARRGEITPQTDIYNLGALMYWVLVRDVMPTALPPSNGDAADAASVRQDHEIKLPVPPHEQNPRIHPLLSQQVMDCIQLDPAERPESMDIVANRLEMIKQVLNDPSAFRSAPN